MKKELISIIIPVYNVEQYLNQCVESIIKQTYSNIEIICINDGSTDNSLTILQELQQKDKRIIVFDKANTGYGDSINVGIEAATGKYVGIIESDDFAEPEMYEKLYNAAEQFDADVTKCNFYEYENGKRTINEYLQYINYDCLYEKDNWLYLLGPTIWCGLYNREYLIRNNIRLLPSPGASYQDTSFAFNVMYAARRVTFIKDALLNYRCDNTSSSVKSNEKIFCIKDEMQFAKNFMQKFPEYTKDLPIYTRVKYLRYKWNLDRLHGANKEIWEEYMREEFLKDYENGYFIKELWFDHEWDFVMQLIEKQGS